MKIATQQDGLFISVDKSLSADQENLADQSIKKRLKPDDPKDRKLADFLKLFIGDSAKTPKS